MVCVHATGLHGRIWEPFVPRLREHFSIVSFDQRGHGDSEKPDEPYDWPSFGEDILAVVDHLELEHPAGLGHSAGAAALVFAETMRPGLFSRVVLLDPVTAPPEMRRFMSNDENPMSAQARRRKAIWDSPDEMLARLRDGTPLSGWRDDILQAYVTYGLVPRDDGRFELKCPPEIEAKIYAMGGKHDGWEKLASLTCPTLLLTGTDSPVWGGNLSKEAASRLQRGRGKVLPGGHFFPMEHPEETLDESVPFLVKAADGSTKDV